MVNESLVESITKMLLSPDKETNDVAFELIRGLEEKDKETLEKMSNLFYGFNKNYFEACALCQERLTKLNH